MALLIILLAVVAVTIAATLRDVFKDGGRSQQPPTSHHEDPTFRAPAARI